MKITCIEPIGLSELQQQQFREQLTVLGHSFSSYDDRSENAEELIARMQDADVVMVSNIPLSKEVLAGCMHLKMIAVAFTGLDHIDMDYCKNNNIQVYNAAGYSTNAVAELALNMMLDLFRKTSEFNTAVRMGATRDNFLGRELTHKTVGIIGTGAIGRRLAEILQVFGCRVLTYSRTVKPVAGNSESVSLERLLQESDIVSVHIPLTSETADLIDEKRIALMKKDAILINTARGPIVNSEAVAKALKEGRIGGYGCDVYEKEPPLPKDHVLFSAPGTLLLPHIGYATEEAICMRAAIVMNNVLNWL